MVCNLRRIFAGSFYLQAVCELAGGSKEEVLISADADAVGSKNSEKWCATCEDS